MTDEWEKTFIMLDSSHMKKDEYIKKLEAVTKDKDDYIKQLENRILLLEGRLKTPNVNVIEQKKQQYEKRVLLLEERLNGHIPLVSLEEKKRIMREYYFKEVPCEQKREETPIKIKHALPWFDK